MRGKKCECDRVSKSDRTEKRGREMKRREGRRGIKNRAEKIAPKPNN